MYIIENQENTECKGKTAESHHTDKNTGSSHFAQGY